MDLIMLLKLLDRIEQMPVKLLRGIFLRIKIKTSIKNVIYIFLIFRFYQLIVDYYSFNYTLRNQFRNHKKRII